MNATDFSNHTFKVQMVTRSSSFCGTQQTPEIKYPILPVFKHMVGFDYLVNILYYIEGRIATDLNKILEDRIKKKNNSDIKQILS